MTISYPQYQKQGHMLRRIQALCKRVTPSLLDKVEVASVELAVERGVFTVQMLLRELAVVGVRPALIESGFGPAHIARLYVNALVLCSAPDLHIDARHLFIGFIAGTLHKMGLVVANRYGEKDNILGYAEVSSLIVRDCFLGNKLGNKAEADLLAYAIGAQTHYGAAAGAESRRQVLPYVDVFDDVPFWCVWLARWCNRLECLGPGFFVRHLLSRVKSLQPGHVDYMKDGFYTSEFAKHMVPSLDPAAGHTMLRHLENFRATQVSTSIYGAHDRGIMLELREAQKERTARILSAVQRPFYNFSNEDQEEILDGFGKFLMTLDGSHDTPAAVSAIFAAFRHLPESTRHAWLRGFLQTMQEYMYWVEDMCPRLNSMPLSYLKLPTICDSLTDYLQPADEWRQWCRLLILYPSTF